MKSTLWTRKDYCSSIFINTPLLSTCLDVFLLAVSETCSHHCFDLILLANPLPNLSSNYSIEICCFYIPFYYSRLLWWNFQNDLIFSKLVFFIHLEGKVLPLQEPSGPRQNFQTTSEAVLSYLKLSITTIEWLSNSR